MKALLTRLVTPQAPATVASTADPTHSPPSKRSRLLSFLSKPASTPSADREVSDYLAQPSLANDANPLAFWKYNRLRFPVLSKQACKHVALPGSSAPVERLFSIAGKIFRPERCSISNSRFKQMMLIRCNCQLD